MGTKHPRLRSLTKPFCVSAIVLGTLACGQEPLAPGDVDPSLSLESARPPSPRAWGFVATADFYEARPATCFETRVDITVKETPGEDPEATLDFRHSVFGICGGQEGLYDHDLRTVQQIPGGRFFLGEVPIDPADFTVHPGLRVAILDTELELFEDESGSFRTVRIQATWDRARRRGRPSSWTADLEISVFNSGPAVNPIATEDAELSRYRR
jgi:hypothetical protein